VVRQLSAQRSRYAVLGDCDSYVVAALLEPHEFLDVIVRDRPGVELFDLKIKLNELLGELPPFVDHARRSSRADDTSNDSFE
jgi:hypothetical protein